MEHMLLRVFILAVGILGVSTGVLDAIDSYTQSGSGVVKILSGILLICGGIILQ